MEQEGGICNDFCVKAKKIQINFAFVQKLSETTRWLFHEKYQLMTTAEAFSKISTRVAVNRIEILGVGFWFGHAFAEPGREASWYEFPREAWEQAVRNGRTKNQAQIPF